MGSQDEIIRGAREAGIDPSAALAIAERESNFDTRARASKTIRGAFQMTGDLRSKYGIGDSDDAYTQAKGWGAFFRDVKKDMSNRLGRDVTDAEGYAGHHFGAGRAARMMTMDPSTPVDSVFTPNEMALNPHFAKAGTVGNLLGSVTSDITRRQAKFGGGEPADFSASSMPADENQMPDYSAMAQPADIPDAKPNNATAMPAALPQAMRQTQVPDFSQSAMPAT